MCKTPSFCTFFVFHKGMRHFYLLLLALLAVTACSTTRRVSTAPAPSSTWVGCTTSEILEAMGSPVRIDGDGRDGSILVYESAPGYDDPKYDIFDPQASAQSRQYARFYLDREGLCYHVDTNRELPPAPRGEAPDAEISAGLDILFDILLLPLLTISIFL